MTLAMRRRGTGGGDRTGRSSVWCPVSPADSQDRVYVFQRFPRSEMMVFEPNGRLITTWGDGAFEQAHGVWMSEDDILYVTDTNGHTVTQWTCDGTLLATWGDARHAGRGDAVQPADAGLSRAIGRGVCDGRLREIIVCIASARRGELELSWGGRRAPGRASSRGRCITSAWTSAGGCWSWIAVTTACRFSPATESIWTSGAILRCPQEMLIDGDNTVYIIGGRLGTQHVTMMTLDGELIARWGEYGTAPRPVCRLAARHVV